MDKYGPAGPAAPSDRQKIDVFSLANIVDRMVNVVADSGLFDDDAFWLEQSELLRQKRDAVNAGFLKFWSHQGEEWLREVKYFRPATASVAAIDQSYLETAEHKPYDSREKTLTDTELYGSKFSSPDIIRCESGGAYAHSKQINPQVLREKVQLVLKYARGELETD